MKLPNRKTAIIEKEKLTSYLFLETHPIGGSKARFFHQIGFDETNIEILIKAFLEIAHSNDIRNVRKTFYGTSYAVDGIIKTPIGRKIMITTVWFIRINENTPRFVTAYPV